MNGDAVRKYFPYLSTGKIYINHASLGPLSSASAARITDYLVMRSATHIDNYEETIATERRVKQKVGQLLHTSPERIAFVDNTTNGLNLLAQGIEWHRGDRIILNDIEFPSNVYPFLNLRNSGVEIDFVRSHNGIVSAEDILAAVTPNTKLISVSFVQFISGYRVDLQKIGSFCKERNIIFCVDGIQGIGALELDVNECHIDFLSTGAQKWLMSLRGIAFIYLSEALQEHLHPRYVGWTSVENTWELLNYDFVLKKTADAFQNGSFSVIGMISLEAALDLFAEFGMNEVEKRILENTRYLMKGLTEVGITPLLAGEATERLSGIVSFATPKAKNIFQHLKSKDIICSLREGMVRLSPHFYNSFDELDKTIETIKGAL